jgi:hypothetical protein
MRKSYVQLAVGLAISGIFLYWVLRPVDFTKLGLALLQFQWLWVIPFLGVTFVSLWLRAVRWRILLSPAREFTSARLFSPLMAGFALNSLLPARAGEFARAVILNRTENLPLAPTFATIIVERLFDMITLLGLLAAVVLFIKIDPAISIPYSTKWTMSGPSAALAILWGGVALTAVAVLYLVSRRSTPPRGALLWTVLATALIGIMGIVAGALGSRWLPATLSGGTDFVINGETLTGLGRNLGTLCILALVGSTAFLVPVTRGFIMALISKVPYAPRFIRDKIRSLAESFASGLESLRSLSSIATVLWLSVALWLLVGVSFQIAALGFPGLSLGFLEGQAVNVITCLAILIPAAPGFWGLMEVGIVFSLLILGVESDPSRALAFALLVHALQYFPILGVGLYFLWSERQRMGHQTLLVTPENFESPLTYESTGGHQSP